MCAPVRVLCPAWCARRASRFEQQRLFVDTRRHRRLRRRIVNFIFIDGDIVVNIIFIDGDIAASGGES